MPRLSLSSWLKTRLADERGANLVEYGLLLALVVLVAIGAITLLGQGRWANFSAVAEPFN